MVWNDRCSMTVTAFESHTFEIVGGSGLATGVWTSSFGGVRVVDMSYDNVNLTPSPRSSVNTFDTCSSTSDVWSKLDRDQLFALTAGPVGGRGCPDGVPIQSVGSLFQGVLSAARSLG